MSDETSCTLRYPGTIAIPPMMRIATGKVTTRPSDSVQPTAIHADSPAQRIPAAMLSRKRVRTRR